MTPPITNSSPKPVAPPVLPDESQTPPPADAGAPAKAGTPKPRPVAELPASTDTAGADAVEEQNDARHETSSFAAPSKKPRMGFEVSVGLSGGANGHRDATLFPRPYGRLGDLFGFNLRTALLWKVNPQHKARFEVGPELSVDVTLGAKGGSNDITYGTVTAGVRAGIDVRDFYESDVGSGPSRFYLSILGLGVGGGLDTPGGVRVYKNVGYAAKLAAGVNLFTVNAGLLEIGGALELSTLLVDGTRFNTNNMMIGGALSFRSSGKGKIVKTEVVREKEVCESLPGEIEEKVARINDPADREGLIAQIEQARAEVAKFKKNVETRELDPFDRETIRDILRQQYIEIALDNLPQEPSSAEEWKALEANLKAEAREEYPDDHDFWEPLAASEDVHSFVLPEKLPKNCKKLTDLSKTIDKTTENLQNLYTSLDRILKTPLHPRIREIVRETIEKVQPNLSEIYFNNDRPKSEDLNALRKAMDGARGPDGKVDFNDKKVRKALETIFKDKKSKTDYVAKVLNDLGETANALNSEAMLSIQSIEVQGHTSLAGSDKHNLALSQRRAEAVVEILVGMGVDRNRLVPKGYGETNPVNPEEEGFPKGSPERANAAAENRRIQLSVSDGEFERVINSSSSLAPIEYSTSQTTYESAAAPREGKKAEGPQPKPASSNAGEGNGPSVRPRPAPQVDESPDDSPKPEPKAKAKSKGKATKSSDSVMEE